MTIVDQRTERHSYAFGMETVETTLTLVRLDAGVGLTFACKFSGVVERRAQGGPIVVRRPARLRVHEGPDVTVDVRDLSVSDRGASVRVSIEIALPVLGIQTIFDQTLAGSWS